MFLDILMFIGLFQGIVFGIVLIFGKIFKGKENRYLACSTILISIIGLNEWAIRHGLDNKYYWIDFFGDDVPWILLVFVPAFIYFQKSLGYNLSNKFKNQVLIIPFLLFLVLNIIIDLNVDFFLIDTPWFVIHKTRIYHIEYYAAVSYTSVLCIVTFYMLKNSNKPTDVKKWLKQIWILFTLLITIWNVLVFIPEKIYEEKMDYFFWIPITLFTYWLIYKGLLQFNLAKDIAFIKSIVLKLENEKKTDIVTARGESVNNKDFEHVNRLEEIVEKEHLYRNPDLTLKDIANKVGLSPGYLSQLINTNLKSNFTGWINSYRICEVKKLIQDEKFDRYSLLAIGLEAGFKSKSAFYSLFKKETGLTPNEYRKTVRKS